METPQGPAAPTSGSEPIAIPAIPVICERCRATGMAGDEAFAAIPDLLNFEPVPRRPHASGWTPEHQRAFVAALAITGSMRQAARHVGKAAFGAEQLRRAKGGRSFDAACEAAIELARERELMRLHENLGELAARTEAANAKSRAVGRFVPTDSPDVRDEEEQPPFIEEVRERLWNKLQKLRGRQLHEHKDDPEWRRAYDLLNGPEDWGSVEAGTWKPTSWPGSPPPGTYPEDDD